MKKYLLIISFSCLINSLNAQYDGDQIFDESYIHEIEITTSLSLLDLFFLFSGELGTGNYTYTLADVVIDGNSLDSIGIRVKGGLTTFDPKKPLKLDFNEFVKGRKYDGLKKINLHQGNMDPSFMREAMTYGLMRNAGLKTVRTSFAKVYVNGRYEGVYTLVEQVNDDFIHNNFASADRALYKTGPNGFGLKYEVDGSFTHAEFIAALNSIPVDLLHEQLPEILDIESFIRFIAVQIFVNAVDGPLTIDENYYIYYEPKSKTYVYIPWDYNLALYGGANYTILQNTGNAIFNKLKQNPTLRNRYLNTFCQLLQYNFDEDRILNQIDIYRELLKDEAPDDPYVVGDFILSVANVENIISARVQALTTEMNNNFSPCDPLITPINYLDVVINEIVASNDTLSGIVDPNGGSADWIELYNNTTNDIDLTGFYLSNTANFLKHWKIPGGILIPAKDYLIVWADRDIEEDGIHSDFKLNKARGDLYLSFENGEIIDYLSYKDQNTNIANARVPNGTGPFISQFATFKATNDIINAIGDQSFEIVSKIFPNPTKGNITVSINSTNSNTILCQVFTLQGLMVMETELQLSKENNSFTVPTSELVGGMYNLSLVDNKTNLRIDHSLIVID